MLRAACSGGVCKTCCFRWRAPRRALTTPKASRWFGNLTITVLNSLLLRALFMILGATAVGVAVMAEAEGVGLFNNVALPFYAKVIIGFLLMEWTVQPKAWK